jgi:DNA-binding transcriptional LysR family regulator
MTFGLLPAPPGPFETVELFTDPFVLIVSQGSPLAERSCPVALHEIAELPMIAPDGCRHMKDFETFMRERGLEANVIHRAGDNGTLHGLVASGAGVAVVAQLVAGSANGVVATLELDEPPPPRRVALAWRSDREFPPRHDAFVKLVQTICRELGLATVPAVAA